jgi:hypothetical protein
MGALIGALYLVAIVVIVAIGGVALGRWKSRGKKCVNPQERYDILYAAWMDSVMMHNLIDDRMCNEEYTKSQLDEMRVVERLLAQQIDWLWKQLEALKGEAS